MYGRKSDAIVGYTFKAQQFCPEHLIEFMVQNGYLSPAARDMRVEDVLDQHAGAEGVDREDQHSFDSDDFPKTILDQQLEEVEECDWNGHSLHD